jgi:hypothetical protein
MSHSPTERAKLNLGTNIPPHNALDIYLSNTAKSALKQAASPSFPLGFLTP